MWKDADLISGGSVLSNVVWIGLQGVAPGRAGGDNALELPEISEVTGRKERRYYPDPVTNT